MLKISNIKLPIGHDQHVLFLALLKKVKVLKLVENDITKMQIFKKSLDARKKDKIHYVYQVLISCKDEQKFVKRLLQQPVKDVEIYQEAERSKLVVGSTPMNYRPVVVGTGPAGLMAGILLAEHGFRPLVFERGRDVDQRQRDIEEFWRSGVLQPESNVQFGEGGAGTFSDGKLTTRIHNTRIDDVYRILIEAGAPEEIAYVHKPHIGTDQLRIVVKNLRKRLLQLGGEVLFDHKVINIDIADNQVRGVVVQSQGESRQVATNHVVLAIGHSARDTFAMLHDKHVHMEPKALAIGVRIEHPQMVINQAQYGVCAEGTLYKDLGPAEYQLVSKQPDDRKRTVYTFCMCPGGQVVAAASEAGGVVTNGMSYHARDLENANAALVVTVEPQDYGYEIGKSPLLGVEYLRKWERKAYLVGGSNYYAPVQLVKDFLACRPTVHVGGNSVQPTYLPGVTPADLHDCLPGYVTDAMKAAIVEFGGKLNGFDMGEAVMTGVETRTSSPIRIVRDEFAESVNCKGLYPTGEGAGYAGGIISAAVDGLKVAEWLIQKHAPCT